MTDLIARLQNAEVGSRELSDDIEKLVPGICLFDNYGRKVGEWLPHMQSSEVLRAIIAKGIRTADCFAELSKRHKRVSDVIARLAWEERAR